MNYIDSSTGSTASFESRDEAASFLVNVGLVTSRNENLLASIIRGKESPQEPTMVTIIDSEGVSHEEQATWADGNPKFSALFVHMGKVGNTTVRATELADPMAAKVLGASYITVIGERLTPATKNADGFWTAADWDITGFEMSDTEEAAKQFAKDYLEAARYIQLDELSNGSSQEGNARNVEQAEADDKWASLMEEVG